MFSIYDYSFDISEKFIAQKPSEHRDKSKLFVLNRKTGHFSHKIFYEIYDLLLPDDVLVVNNTEVIPGRLFGHKETGGKAEILILDYANSFENHSNKDDFICDCIIKASKKTKPGTNLFFDQGLKAKVISRQDEICTLKFSCKDDFNNYLYRIGRVPLPPYIKRDTDTSPDEISYQTVYASQKGAIAAPTAGLHFTKKLFEKLRLKGIKIVEITLHVGYGTFLPVRIPDIRKHKMHSEWYHITEKSADIINQAKANGCRIVAVGTTSVRTLEYASDKNGIISHGSGRCDLFIYPGYRFKIVDSMITNFHLPESTLLMLISAFAGRKRVLEAYKEALNNDYRFYSYGDAMYII